MSVVLYKKTEDEWKQGIFEPDLIHAKIQDGWSVTMEENIAEEEAPFLEDLPNDEIRELAKSAGIENWDDARIKTLTKKLRELDNGTVKG